MSRRESPSYIISFFIHQLKEHPDKCIQPVNIVITVSKI